MKPNLYIAISTILYSGFVFADCNPWVRAFEKNELRKFIAEAEVPQEMTWYVESEVSLPEMHDNVAVHKTARAHMFPLQTSERVCTTLTMRYLFPDKGKYAEKIAGDNNWQIGKWQRDRSPFHWQKTKIYVAPATDKSVLLDCSSTDPKEYFELQNIVERDAVAIVDLENEIREKANIFEKTMNCGAGSSVPDCIGFDSRDNIIVSLATERPYRLGEKPSPMQYVIGFKRNRNKCHAPKYVVFDLVKDQIEVTNVYQPIY